ncbi:hypothetical protein Aph02nite_62080 [Actinoplanes philippinensis]|nr:hypothetical protein Aph02nite_62080 [Actinoplanes philippinensis]
MKEWCGGGAGRALRKREVTAPRTAAGGEVSTVDPAEGSLSSRIASGLIRGNAINAVH